jgi:alpha-mannosidase
MSVTGAAPGADAGLQYSVMIAFPLADPKSPHQRAPVTNMTYGTPYHWVSQMPEPYWDAPIFQATHNFVLPQSESGYLGAIYHADIHAWAVDDDNAVIGCILRNTPNQNSRGACGTDTGTHTHRYALRVRSGLQDPSTCAPLCESLRFQMPFHAAYAGPAPQDGTAFTVPFSLAGVTTPDAIITAAKQGTIDPSSLVLRIYQPTNNASDMPLNVTVDLTNFAAAVMAQAPVLTARCVTALEAEIDGEQDLPVVNGSVSFTVQRALTTLRVHAVPPDTTR